MNNLKSYVEALKVKCKEALDNKNEILSEGFRAAILTAEEGLKFGDDLEKHLKDLIELKDKCRVIQDRSDILVLNFMIECAEYGLTECAQHRESK